MQRKTLAKWLVSSALVCFGLFLGTGLASAQEGNVVQGQNGSTGSDGSSAAVTTSNDLTFGVGTAARGQAAPASASQNGDNAADLGQGAHGRSGDAAAGSQVFGTAGDGATIQAQQSSADAFARSQEVDVLNDSGLGIYVGPQAFGTDDATAAAQASQIGDNSLEASLVTSAVSGDAVAGSQVVGIIGNGDHTVQISNSANDVDAESGPIEADGTLEAIVGPVASSDQAVASVSQIGDNDAVLRQSTVAISGDAVAGSQVTGILGNGSSTVQNSNVAVAGDVAESGQVLVFSVIDDVIIGPSASSGSAPAQASQIGNSSGTIEQALSANSGDAVTGSQVTGLVADQAGHITVQNQQSSEDDSAVSGEVGSAGDLRGGSSDAANTVGLIRVGATSESDAGSAQASQEGDAALAIAQQAAVTSGDAVAGAQITGAIAEGRDVTVQNQNASLGSTSVSGTSGVDTGFNEASEIVVGALAVSGDADAQASQIGDDRLAIDQAATLTTGDAVSGSQVTGVVSDPSGATVQSQNASEDASAESGEVDAESVNIVTNLVVGPLAEASGSNASASQIGDNDVAIGQDALLQSGDAVAGSQVTGVVINGSDVTIQQHNTSTGATANPTSGDGEVSPRVVNELFAARFGPEADSEGAGTAQASQQGDNAVAVDQTGIVTTGDAVAGSQVSGIAADNADVTMQLSQTSDNAVATAGYATPDAVNSVEGAFGSGPLVAALDADAQASQVGDNALAVSQAGVVSTGDAVAGSQVSGVVGHGDVTVQNHNVSESDAATSGASDGALVNQLIDAVVGPQAFADAESSSASQIGDNDAALAQAAGLTTGDAVAGAQVTGIVASAGEVTVQNNNTSADVTAESGQTALDVTVNEISGFFVGPVADAGLATASASQVGSNEAGATQVATLKSGDAVAGAQVTGLVVALRDVTVQNQNVSDASTAATGDVESTNLLTAMFVGPQAFGGDGSASSEQSGDNEIDLSQSASASTGEAVAGAQVVGAAQDDAFVQLQNAANDGDALSEQAMSTNEATGSVGPLALAEGSSPASAQQLGDTSLEAGQVSNASTGDAVAGGQVVGMVGFASAAVFADTALAPATAGDSSFEFSTAAAA